MPVYMIRQGERGPVKIGVAKDVARRLEFMQTGNHERLVLLRTFEGGAAEERRLHRLFADHRLAGEWFSFTKAMLGDVGLTETTVGRPVEQDAQPVVEFVSEPTAIQISDGKFNDVIDMAALLARSAVVAAVDHTRRHTKEMAELLEYLNEPFLPPMEADGLA